MDVMRNLSKHILAIIQSRTAWVIDRRKEDQWVRTMNGETRNLNDPYMVYLIEGLLQHELATRTDGKVVIEYDNDVNKVIVKAGREVICEPRLRFPDTGLIAALAKLLDDL